MKTTVEVTLTIAVMVLLAGCGEPVVNTSTEANMETSIEKVRNALPVERRAKFDEALQVISFNQFDFGSMLSEAFAGGQPNMDRAVTNIHAMIEGRTGEEIIQLADKVVRERAQRECTQATGEIGELLAQKETADAAAHELDAFVVSRSRYSMQTSSFLTYPVLELTVLNGTPHAISFAYFEGTLASPGRAVPWHQDQFGYRIPGGLEPGEEATWRLTPGHSGWNDLKRDDNAVFTVTVQRLDGADGERLYPSVEFSERDERRLKELETRFAETCASGG